MDFYAERILSDGRKVLVYPLTYGRARLSICNQYCEMFFDASYWYSTPEEAVASLNKWNPEEESEPSGWFRSPDTGRRRPDGDPDQEYISWWTNNFLYPDFSFRIQDNS